MDIEGCLLGVFLVMAVILLLVIIVMLLPLIVTIGIEAWGELLQ